MFVQFLAELLEKIQQIFIAENEFLGAKVIARFIELISTGDAAKFAYDTFLTVKEFKMAEVFATLFNLTY